MQVIRSAVLQSHVFCEIGYYIYSFYSPNIGSNSFYAPQLYRQVLLRRVLAMGILSVCLSVRHGPVQKQPSDI